MSLKKNLRTKTTRTPTTRSPFNQFFFCSLFFFFTSISFPVLLFCVFFQRLWLIFFLYIFFFTFFSTDYRRPHPFTASVPFAFLFFPFSFVPFFLFCFRFVIRFPFLPPPPLFRFSFLFHSRFLLVGTWNLLDLIKVGMRSLSLSVIFLFFSSIDFFFFFLPLRRFVFCLFF